MCLSFVITAAWAPSRPPWVAKPRAPAVRWLCATQAAAPTGATAVFSPSRMKLNGVEHYVRDTGDPAPSAPIAVCLHGFAGNTDSW